jgi:ubiquinone/menaquinone biosynthesis C-methylase UbiE
MTGYNLIAPFYQFFVKLVFGDLLFKAQTHFLTNDLSPAQILIVGGGTGEILSFCLTQYPKAQITYIESSKKMIEISKKKIPEKNADRVNFQCKNILEWNSNLRFDLVLLPFVLDLFNDQHGMQLLSSLKDLGSDKCQLLVTDFSRTSSTFQKALVKLMYFLFNSVNASERSSLPDFNTLFRENFWVIETQHRHGKKIYLNLVTSYQLVLCNTT